MKHSSYLCLTNKSWIRFLIEDWLLLFYFFSYVFQLTRDRISDSVVLLFMQQGSYNKRRKKRSKNRMAIWLSLEWLISLFFIYFLICYFLSCFFVVLISYTFEECNFLLITTPAKKSTASKDKSTTTLMLNCENGLSENI